MKNKRLFISVNGEEAIPAHELFSRALFGKEPMDNCLKQLNTSVPIKTIHGHSSGIMDGFAKIAKEPLTPENKARVDELESYFEKTEGPIVLFDFGFALEDSSHEPENETLLSSYPEERLNGNPFALIHENGTGVAYWSPKTGLVFYVPHDAELVEVIRSKPIQGNLEFTIKERII